MPHPSFYVSDFAVAELARLMKDQQIAVPWFQRKYIWSREQASKFIESLLLGWPVGQVVLQELPDHEAYQVVDGHQRLKSLLFFYEGTWIDGDGFSLVSVSDERLNGRTYATLDSQDRDALDQALVRAVIIRGGSEDAIQIFERMNLHSQKLTRYQLMQARFVGPLAELVHQLETNPCWQCLVQFHARVPGEYDDQYLILRFLSNYHGINAVGKSGKDAIEWFIEANRDFHVSSAGEIITLFTSTMCAIRDAIGPKAFCPKGKFHLSMFDALTLGVAHRLSRGPILDSPELLHASESLYENLRPVLRVWPRQRVKLADEIGRRQFEGIQ